MMNSLDRSGFSGYSQNTNPSAEPAPIQKDALSELKNRCSDQISSSKPGTALPETILNSFPQLSLNDSSAIREASLERSYTACLDRPRECSDEVEKSSSENSSDGEVGVKNQPIFQQSNVLDYRPQSNISDYRPEPKVLSHSLCNIQFNGFQPIKVCFPRPKGYREIEKPFVPVVKPKEIEKSPIPVIKPKEIEKPPVQIVEPIINQSSSSKPSFEFKPWEKKFPTLPKRGQA